MYFFRKITKASISNASEIAWMNYTANFGKLHSLEVYGVKDIPGTKKQFM